MNQVPEITHLGQFPDLDVWLQNAADLLAGNRISMDGHSYTGPSLVTTDFGRKDYANQFLWDSSSYL